MTNSTEKNGFRVSADIIETRTVYKSPGKYIGWPTIAKAGPEELMIVFSGDREYHACPWGKSFLTRSFDGGNSWQEPELVNNTPLDDRDTGLLVTKKGTLILTWFTSLAFEDPDIMRFVFEDPVEKKRVMDGWETHIRSITHAEREQWLHSFIRRSTDNGHTWEEPIAVPVSTPHGPIQLSDGRLLYIGRNFYGDPSLPLEKRQELHRKHIGRVEVMESVDDGISWQTIGSVPQNEAYRYGCEPYAVECSDGRLVAFLRETIMGVTESEDGGRTWSMPRSSGVAGYPPHLLRLRDGRILNVFSRRVPPNGQYAMLSEDDCRSWSQPMQISFAPNADHGYPSTVELDDGTLLTAYYEIDIPGEKPALKTTKWQVKN